MRVWRRPGSSVLVTLATGAGPAMAGANTTPASSLEDAGRLVDLLVGRLGSVGAELAQQLQGRKAPASAEEAGRLVDQLVDRLGSLGAELRAAAALRARGSDHRPDGTRDERPPLTVPWLTIMLDHRSEKTRAHPRASEWAGGAPRRVRAGRDPARRRHPDRRDGSGRSPRPGARGPGAGRGEGARGGAAARGAAHRAAPRHRAGQDTVDRRAADPAAGVAQAACTTVAPGEAPATPPAARPSARDGRAPVGTPDRKRDDGLEGRRGRGLDIGSGIA